tara:strand:+ start:1285 stop:1764 length:480 start_codon:yes stop_codon:yes gene_type:complete
MSNLYYQTVKVNDINTNTFLNKRQQLLSKDTRPQISVNKGHVELSERGENDKIIKKIRDNELEQEKNRKTIMDMPLRDILEKTSEVSSDFWSDYKTNLAEVEINRKTNDPNYDNKNLSSIIGIHIIGLIKYMREGDHVLYMGILFVIISIILYVFNIII